MNFRVPLVSISLWIFSMLLHASGLCVAILLAAEFSVVPRVAPFRWDVTLIAASRTESLISDTPAPALVSSARMEPVKPAVHRMNASKPPTEASPQEPSIEAPTTTGMICPVSNPIPTEMPPPGMEASDRSDMAMEPSIPELHRLVTLPAAQFRPTPVSRHALSDYGWLASVVAGEVEQVKRYPAQAKWHRWQGKVVVQTVIHGDGHISDIEVVASSGHDTLDHDAIALLERISPMQLQHPLDQSFIVVRIPIGYRLEQDRDYAT